MDRLCKFSTSILAGNVATLLLVAMVTDYWQHRGFDLDELRRRLDRAREAFAASSERWDDRRPWETAGPGDPSGLGAAANRTDLSGPSDTATYAVLGYRHAAFRGYPTAAADWRQNATALAVHLESPVLLVQAWDRASMAQVFDMAYLYSEHGSLMRDCKQLESLSIERLPFPPGSKVRCEWFLFGRRRGHFVREHLPAIYYLEIAAAAFAVAALASTLVSLVSGVRGNLRRESAALTRAAALSIASATCCTLTIALFHAKLNVRAKRPLFADEQPATLELLAWLRPAEKVSFGWSFYLAWLCVAMSMAEAAMWLHQMDRRERDAEWDRNRDLVERIRAYYRERDCARGACED